MSTARPLPRLRRSAALAILAAIVPTVAHAQPRVVAGASLAPAVAANLAAVPATSATRAVAIPEGTEFTAVTAEALSSKTASEGDRVALKVDENVVVGGVTVIAKGASVRATVAEAKSAGFMGRGGKLSLRIESATTVDGQHVALRASKAKVGDNALGLLKKGKDASYPEGTRMTVFTDQALTVTPVAP